MQHPISKILDSLPPITGRQLRAARVLAELTRPQLADLAGISQVTIDQHEQSGGQLITALLETRVRLVEALHRAGVWLGPDEKLGRVL